MKPLIFDLYAAPELFAALSTELNAEPAKLEHRQFPDGETYMRVHSDYQQREAIIVSNMHQPNSKFLPLVYLCETLRELGIASTTLVCPYLPYMRQDIKFHEGEALTSRYYAKLLNQYLDRLITIDPHLHRYHSLGEIYTMETHTLQANPLIASWVKENIETPLVVGPDSESEQWAAAAADMIGCPYLILEKQRFGDKNVEVSSPNAQDFAQRTPVLIDDIISTGRTMIRTAEALVAEGLQEPICIGVHALFSEDAYCEMSKAPIKDILTCNTVPHSTNTIDIASIIAEVLK
ncbi:phosphoribosylpyrophosphate synthetase [Oleiphilus sp. HI0081]|uniref:ribose-phosphate pyrophosphokinase n=2 Tax=Oleiphilus TaxID=141450 RepID=UPI0007C3BBA6|nr:MULTISPECIES: ribose-phosphate pyrophosphokinase [unclassified Oleiphilus]KZY75010.1 phosphoribosylpyrophosphate synthetase [Oleiphilus sp. HI0068]KZY82176.1 phosphoribosylpyrophosphate synthetase [Oleiphilus sp. HI0069]KZY86236.1 phosphoribosylpyrophosphate synthetase [Oleiphilus sp. HI0072]KZZ10835.1 phosphoribosylpyrophosphate synthetase [Oleiphilus sp. HI0078]KZZ21082.1 phosphoribosylpyrophosphate synthetase [Oleiphilus sp. HI0081]KZZ31429.1 phosphoribosylpyrophosphate synthetase [Olei